MQALEVTVNGQRICIAGTTPNRVLAIGMSWTARDPRWTFNLGGVTDRESEDHFAWNLPKLAVGDEVSIRIIESETCDDPDRIYHPAEPEDSRRT